MPRTMDRSCPPLESLAEILAVALHLQREEVQVASVAQLVVG